MKEVYLFVHPLCPQCLKIEEKVLSLIQKQKVTVSLRLIPLLNMRSFNNCHDHLCLCRTATIEERNCQFSSHYNTALDYKTIQLQGNKKAIAFLKALQQKICLENIPYSSELTLSILEDLKLDKGKFLRNRYSEHSRNSFVSDQLIAREMGVIEKTAIVIFDVDTNAPQGILHENPSIAFIEQLFDFTKKDCPAHSLIQIVEVLAKKENFADTLYKK